MYRFRSVENLIGKFQELEKQQIYFADVKQLNDPLEGRREVFWQGDKILWRNLLKHYILCLENIIVLCRLTRDDEEIDKSIPVFMMYSELPTQKYKERYDKICNNFFADQFVNSYLEFLINHSKKVYSEELYVHLKLLHNSALEVIFKVDMDAAIMSKDIKIQTKHEEIIGENFNNISSNHSEYYDTIIEVLYECVRNLDSSLLAHSNNTTKEQFVFIEFPKIYLENMLELTYPKAYVACFMDNCSNSSVWGTYGDNHRGVCLKYRMDNSNPLLHLKVAYGLNSSGKMYDYKEFALKPMKYATEFQDFNFFKNIGRLPLKKFEDWYTDEEGNISSLYKEISDDFEEWRNKHWKQFEEAYFLKLPDWKHEKEYRILLCDMLGMYSEKQDRLLEYKFEDLEAIIFGLNTPFKDRLKIKNIIEKKCREHSRDTFTFYEMTYSNHKKKFYQRELKWFNG